MNEGEEVSRAGGGEIELPSDESLQTAAHCWCDPETKGIEYDSRLAVAFAWRLDEVKADKRSARDIPEVQAMREALEFYRAHGNWIKGSGEAFSPIIADTGTRASQALAAFDKLK
jgi:hypothetical protein